MKKLVLSLSIILTTIVSVAAQSAASASPINDKFIAFENSLFEKLNINSDQKSMLNESLIWHKLQMIKINKELPANDPATTMKIAQQRAALESKVKTFLSTEQQNKLKEVLVKSQDKSTGLNAGE